MPYLPTLGLWEAAPRRRRAAPAAPSPTCRTCTRTSTATARSWPAACRCSSTCGGIPSTATRRTTCGARSASRIRPARSRPRPSAPSDREVAFLSDSGGHANLWVTDTGSGQLRQITYERDPAVVAGRADLVARREVDCLCLVTRQHRAGVWRLARESRRRQPAECRATRPRVSRGLPMRGGSTTPMPACSTRCPPTAGRRCASGRVRRATWSASHGDTLYFMVDRTLTDGSPGFEIHAATPEDGAVARARADPCEPCAAVADRQPALSPGRRVARDAAHRRRDDQHLDPVDVDR